MSKTTRKEKEQGYGIHTNENLCEQTFAVFWDALSHMGEDTVYQADAEAQYWFNNGFGCGVYTLVTGCSSKFVSTMHQFPPLHHIFFL